MKTEIIAEIAQAHDGSLGILHSYIDALAGTGVDTVKFQMHIAHAESSAHEPFRVPFSYEDPTRYDYWKRMEFTFEQWEGIVRHCAEKNLRFLCSPFSIEAFEWLEKLGAERYKIASGEVSNYLLLDRIAASGKPILLSSGMSAFTEIEAALQRIQSRSGKVEAVFQCTTSYPTPPEAVGLNVIPEIMERWNITAGLSDHSGEIWASLAAVTLGARKLEFHAVFDKRMFGPDAGSSLDMQQITELCRGVRAIETMQAHPADKHDDSRFSALRNMFGKSLGLRRDMEAGASIQASDLESKKPGGMGIPASEYESMIGRRLLQAKTAGSFLQQKDLE
jgi:N,N'-diacetyllegionaminate synthase